MSQNEKLIATLQREGSLRFKVNEENAKFVIDQLDQTKITKVNEVSCLHTGDQPRVDNTCVRIYPTGHMAFYNPVGRRFLSADPDGHPLNESEWLQDENSGEWKLHHVRMQLDNRQWIGIHPRAKTFNTPIDIKGQSGWENISLDDLRHKAAEAWRVPFSEVKYFYKDENLVDKGDGKYDVSLTKDGLYALVEGGFEKTVFISFMCSVNWEKLDLIPVVELFQSTLPGSGGATFEFIWGLYDDQNRDDDLGTIRYRGLPTYPSKEAFYIFSAFFIPGGMAKDKIFNTFTNPDRSHEITWTPQPNPPLRYFNKKYKITLTVQGGYLFKVTDWEDSVPIPYTNPAIGGKPNCQREIRVDTNFFEMINGEQVREIPFAWEWKILPQEPTKTSKAKAPFTWKWFFNGFPPEVDPVKAIYTLPFYPEGDAEIEESSLQPMVLDQMFYYMEMSPGMKKKLEKTEKVLVHTLDSVIAGCIDCTQEREYTVLYSDPEFAQKNACLLWSYGAQKNELKNLTKVSFLPEGENVVEAYKEKYGLIFKWIPFMYHQDREACESMLKALSGALLTGGLMFLAAPKPLEGLFNHYKLETLYNDPVVNMPYYRQHLKMCPENIVNPDLTVFLLEKIDKPKTQVVEEKKIPSQQVEIPMAPLRSFKREDKDVN